MPDQSQERAELLARIRQLRADLADAAERLAIANLKGDCRELRARAEKVEGEVGELIKLLDWPTS